MASRKKPPATDPAATPLPVGLNLLDPRLAASMKDSAQQIWLAGMGAFAQAQAQGGKVFESLVKEGLALQQHTQAVAQEKLGEVREKVSGLAKEAGAQAGQQWDRLETIFEDRVAKALHRLGIPSAADLQALNERLDALTAQLAALERQGAQAGTPPADKAKAPARKAAARKRAGPAASTRSR